MARDGRRATALRDAVARCAGRLELASLFESVVGAASELLGAERATLFVIDDAPATEQQGDDGGSGIAGSGIGGSGGGVGSSGGGGGGSGKKVLFSAVAQGSAGTITVPLDARSLVGAAALGGAGGRAVNVPDAYADARFSRASDRRSGPSPKLLFLLRNDTC